MIPFFRKIRKQLADDNQFLKYSRYAIGEIVLVVIGILIALQVNNWNEERKEDKELMQYKKRLIVQFRGDSVQISTSKKGYEFVRPMFRALDSTFHENNKGRVRGDSILRIPVFITLQSEFISGVHALSELQSTGKMSLIKNDSLKDQLTQYQNLVQQQHDVINRTKIKMDQFDNLLYQVAKYDDSHQMFYLVEARMVRNDAFMNEYRLIDGSREAQHMLLEQISQANQNILQLLRD